MLIAAADLLDDRGRVLRSAMQRHVTMRRAIQIMISVHKRRTAGRNAVLAMTASLFVTIVPAWAQSEEAAATSQPINIWQYALAHPVLDSSLNFEPTIGASVPTSVQLVPLVGNSTYVYFYLSGQPVIVDVATRSVVKIGDTSKAE